MRIGNGNNYNYTNISLLKNKTAASVLLNSTNKKNQPLSNLKDLLCSSTYDDDLYFNYADMLKGAKNKNVGNGLSLSLRIDPSKPLQTPEREFVQMESVTKEQIDFTKNHRNNRVNYSEMFLSGLGNDVFDKYLSDKDIALSEDAKFDISVDGYGKVTVTGLDDVELTNKLQDTMSYDFPFIRSVLAMFEESKQTIENNAKDGGMGMSYDQHWKMQINSTLLTEYEVSLTDLSFDKNGKIQGLPESLNDKIYGDRKDMSRIESEYFDFLRDQIAYLINKNPESISTYNVSLTYDKGKINANE